LNSYNLVVMPIWCSHLNSYESAYKTITSSNFDDNWQYYLESRQFFLKISGMQWGIHWSMIVSDARTKIPEFRRIKAIHKVAFRP